MLAVDVSGLEPAVGCVRSDPVRNAEAVGGMRCKKLAWACQSAAYMHNRNVCASWWLRVAAEKCMRSARIVWETWKFRPEF